MAAAPYKVTLALKQVNAAGQVTGSKTLPMTASDVAAAFWLFPSGANNLPLSGSATTIIADIIYTAAGTDTTQVAVYMNGFDTGIRIYNATNLGTVINRQIASSPIVVPAGAVVQFVQLA